MSGSAEAVAAAVETLEDCSAAVALADDFAVGVALSMAVLGGVDADPLAGLCESAVEPLVGGVAVELPIDGLDLLLLAKFFDGLREELVAPLLTPSLSAIAITAFSLEFATKSFAGSDDSAWLKVDDATRGLLFESDVTWSSTTAAPITPTTIVPKAIPK